MHRTTLTSIAGLAAAAALMLPAAALADDPSPPTAPSVSGLPSLDPDPTPTPQPVPGPPAAPATAPAAPAAPGPGQVLGVRVSGRRLVIQLTCAADGTVALRGAHGSLGTGRLACRSGVGTAAVRVAKRTAAQARRHRLTARVVLRSAGRTLTAPLFAPTARQLADAPLVTVRRTCVGSGSGHGGNETIAVDSNTLFGTSLGTDIWWKSYVYLYNPSSPGAAHWQQADGWQRYTASDTSQSAYTTPDGRLIITGGLVTTTRQEWTMPTHNFVYMEVLAWTKGTGFMWVVVPPNQVFAPALQSGAWCGYR